MGRGDRENPLTCIEKEGGSVFKIITAVGADNPKKGCRKQCDELDFRSS
jgi:hypothetical protein